MTSSTDSSPLDGIYFSTIEANGIRHRLASTVSNLEHYRDIGCDRRKKHLLFLLHGFPESWYSWRHQLLHFKEDKDGEDCFDCLPVAPDMRGYGSTSQPDSVDDYTQPVLATDVIELAAALGYEKFIVVGHDWGAGLAWSVSLLYPEKVLGVVGLSVPYTGHGPAGFLTILQHQHGRCLDESATREEKLKTTFHYILHHCLPRVEEEYDKNCRELLYRVYASREGMDVVEGTPEVDIQGLMFPPTGDEDADRTRVLDATAAPGLWARIPKARTLPTWLSEDDLEYYVSEFTRAGFSGGLRWYQALDKNFALMKEALDSDGDNDGSNKRSKVQPPSMFLMGKDDMVMAMFGGKEKVVEGLKEHCPHMLKEAVFVEGAGHWVQQECPSEVNEALTSFLSVVCTAEGKDAKL